MQSITQAYIGPGAVQLGGVSNKVNVNAATMAINGPHNVQTGRVPVTMRTGVGAGSQSLIVNANCHPSRTQQQNQRWGTMLQRGSAATNRTTQINNNRVTVTRRHRRQRGKGNGNEANGNNVANRNVTISKRYNNHNVRNESTPNKITTTNQPKRRWPMNVVVQQSARYAVKCCGG